MKLPPNVTFDEDLRLCLWRPRLILNEAVVNKVIAFLGTKEAIPISHSIDSAIPRVSMRSI